MPRRPAKLTQAEIKRALRAAKSEGVAEVTLLHSEGLIKFSLQAGFTAPDISGDEEQSWAASEQLQRFEKRSKSG